MSKKKEYDVNYQVQYGDSCVFRQTINLTRRTFSKLQDNLLCERVFNDGKKDDETIYDSLYLSVPLNKIGSMVFFNHTQRDFFAKYISKHLKKPLLDRNTCFCLID